MSNNNLSIALAYYKAINEKNPQLAAEKLAQNIEVHTPLASKTGKADVVNALTNFSSVVEKVTVTAKFCSENQVMLAFDFCFPEPTGIVRAAGLLNFEDNLITRIELFYDGLALMAKKEEIFSSALPIHE